MAADRWHPWSRLTPTVRVVLFTAFLGALALVFVVAERGWRPPAASLGISWLAIAIGFGASMLLGVHLEFRNDALSFTLCEIPLIVGLIALPPAQVPLARLVGVGVVLIIQRRPAVKLGFNLALVAFEAATAAAVYHAVLAHNAAFTPAGWLAAAAATTTLNIVSTLAVPAAMRLYGGRVEPGIWRSSAIAGAISLVAGTSLALITATVLAQSGWTAVLLAVVAAMLYLLTRAHASLSGRYANLQVLYDFTRKVGASRDGELMLTTMLDQARTVLRAQTAELLLFSGASAHPVRTALAESNRSPMAPVDDEQAYALEASVRAIGRAVVIGRNGGTDEQRAEVTRRGYRDVIVAPLNIDDGTTGTLLVANRLGDVSSFDEEDSRLFQALADLAAVALENSRLIDELRQEALQKEYQSLHDPLTGLPNRTLFHREIDAAVAATHGTSSLVAVMLMDLDRFKDVNDTLGHHVGDVLLKDIGTRLTRALGDRGLVGRLGGDEFGILLRSIADTEMARAVAALLVSSLERSFPLGDLHVDVGASIGIAMAPGDGDGGTVLLQRADVAMYSAKAGGVVEFYQADKDRNSPRRLSLMGELRKALDGGEIAVYHQPKADLRTGVIVGTEALVRWNHPDHGLMPPAEFIPIAEHSGLIGALTRHVLEVAMVQCREWLEAGISLGVAANLPVRSLLDAGLPAEIRRVLDYAGVGAEHLTLEITEGSLIMDPPRAIAVLQRLADLGVKLSIDDFGTGYSSLSYLKRLPVSELKIDRCFVSSMTSDPHDAAIVRSTADLGHNLGLSVVAEGVEDWKTWQQLIESNVDVAQGYLLSRPLPAADFLTWLRLWQPDQVSERIVAAGKPRLAAVTTTTKPTAPEADRWSAILHAKAR